MAVRHLTPGRTGTLTVESPRALGAGTGEATILITECARVTFEPTVEKPLGESPWLPGWRPHKPRREYPESGCAR